MATGTALSGMPTAVLYLDVRRAGGSGNAVGRIVVTLQDCATTAGACTDLATVAQNVGSQGSGMQNETFVLPLTSAAVLPGHLIRLRIGLDTQGNADEVLLSYASVDAPSALDLTAAPPP